MAQSERACVYNAQNWPMVQERGLIHATSIALVKKGSMQEAHRSIAIGVMYSCDYILVRSPPLNNDILNDLLVVFTNPHFNFKAP